MPQQLNVSVENNFTKGLITDSTGLNFPENAATDTDNCTYTLVGETLRREGFDFETNHSFNTVVSSQVAYNTYKWNNAGGDGLTQVLVTQIGNNLYFYLSSAATQAAPLSNQLLASVINITAFMPLGSPEGSNIASSEVQFTDGNGYLFCTHQYLEPFYCTYSNGAVSATPIIVQTRDFTGVIEQPVKPVTFRPAGLSAVHQYNLQNQGWSAAPAWNTSSNSQIGIAIGSTLGFFDVPTNLPAHVGDPVFILGGISWFSADHKVLHVSNFQIFGVISAYSSAGMLVTTGSFTVDVPINGAIQTEQWYIMPGTNNNYTSSWFSAVGNYPSNADVWWRFKDTSNNFNPASTLAQTTLSSPAPKGSVILNVFNQQPGTVTGTPNLGSTTTPIRPRTCTWFQGRVWYAGVDASTSTAGPNNNTFYTWTESIYFSQVVESVSNFGKCYQTNDPTSETLFDLLPTDGGVIQIQGCGSIYKLFPIQNGMLVFAANGVWFITGSQGIGFTANDYTITKISNIRSISSTSFINVLGLPYFWNEDGIYQVAPTQGGGLSVESITVGIIQTFFSNIPPDSRKYARGDYDPISYQIQWLYRSTQENDVTSRYAFDRILNYNTYNKAWFPYTITGLPDLIGINFVSSPGGSSAPDATFKYFTRVPTNLFTFSEELDGNFVDFFSLDLAGTNYTSYFVTGYKIRGQAIRRFQPQYIQMFCKNNGVASGYFVQGIWDYANSRDSNRYSVKQRVQNALTNFGVVFRRHKIRGHGYTLQFKISSIDNTPFNLIGWSVVDTVNAGT